MRVKFWGVRGSIPAPGLEFVEYGGNSTFITIHDIAGWDDNEHLALDFGSGAKDFSRDLAEAGPANDIRVLALMSHFHWDHMNGFPFFTPIYLKGNLVRLFSSNRIAMRESIAMQSNGINFPVDIGEVAAEIEYNQILHCQRIYAPSVKEAAPAFHSSGNGMQMDRRGLVIDTLPLNHPQGCTGYRIRELATDQVFVYATDHETNEYVDLGLVKFMSDSHLIYVDGMYTNANIDQFRGYGHSSWEECADMFAAAGNARRMLIGHHNYITTDTELADIDAQLKARFPDGQVQLAREGMDIGL